MGIFISKKGVLQVGKTKRGKGTKIMAITDGNGLPIALVEATLDETLTSEYPSKLIGNKAYDSDTLDEQIYEQYGVEMVAPHKTNLKTQQRWTVEHYDDTSGVGKWNGYLRGYNSFVAL